MIPYHILLNKSCGYFTIEVETMEGLYMQVYNYLIGTYPTKQSIKYPVRNRKELVKVYDKIVSLSKRTPYCKINISKENQEYTLGIKEAALDLKTKLIDILDPDISGFHSKMVSASNPDILSVELLTKDTEDFPNRIEMKINSLAEGQVNVGRELVNTSYSLTPGEYYFNVIMDQTYSLTFIQEERKNNLDTLNDLAEFLSRNVPGIHASVEKDEKKNYSRIKIFSDMTGRYGERSFTFEDEKVFRRGVVELFGMNWMEKAAAPAYFELNGLEKQTAASTFTLENTLLISLKESGDEPVVVRITPDSNRILKAVNTVLSTYNRILEHANNRMIDHAEHYGATKLAGEMVSFYKLYEEELSANGIYRMEDGTLELETSLAASSAMDGNMEGLFTEDNGFITKLMEKAEAIAINPMEYLDKTIVLYPNTMKDTFCNPYVTSMYSGLFFNSYC